MKQIFSIIAFCCICLLSCSEPKDAASDDGQQYDSVMIEEDDLTFEGKLGLDRKLKLRLFFSNLSENVYTVSGTIENLPDSAISRVDGEMSEVSNDLRLTVYKDDEHQYPIGKLELTLTLAADGANSTAEGHWIGRGGVEQQRILLTQRRPPGSVPLESHLFEESYSRQRGRSDLKRRTRLKFPQIKSSQKPHLKINDTIRHWALHALTEESPGSPDFRRQAPCLKDIEQALQAQLPRRGKGSPPRVSLQEHITIDHEFIALFNANDLLCLRMHRDVYLGGAHNAFGATHLIFDLKTGNSLGISDIFKPGYKPEVTAMVEDAFRKYFDLEPGQPLSTPGPLDPEWTLNGNLMLNEEGLGFYYDPYEIGPFSIGAPQAVIPLTKLRPWLQEDCPLQRLLPACL